MSDKDYHPPVDRLLAYGDCSDLPDWPNYLALGLIAEHIPDLIRMALDEELSDGVADSLSVWAPVHAWRALGQLRAEAAAEPLTQLFQRVDELDDDWVGEQLPVVFGMIGATAIPALRTYLADSTHGLYARLAAAHSLAEIGRQHPEAHEDVVVALTQQLQQFIENNTSLNGFIISYLVDLKAMEAASVIEQAFAFNRVDTMVMGDWEDAQVALGLKVGREAPPQHSEWDQLLTETAPISSGRTKAASKDKAKAKTRRKQAKKSRQKNRKRK